MTSMQASLAKFQAALTKATKEMVPFEAELATKKIALDTLNAIVHHTPVDIGTARGNWQVTTNTPATTILDIKDKSGARTIQEGTNKIATSRAPQGTNIWLTNNVPYIERLENGWSAQKPDGILTPALNELRNETLGEFE